jgi:hypothetical protein
MSNDADTDSLARVSIQPGVSILSVLRHLNYKPWFALAEFVDNAIQSFLDCRSQLNDSDRQTQVTVSIELDTDGRQLTIRDNAGGIHNVDYPRAFRPASVPPDRTGLAEFGMGLKSAACWFAPRWSVRTTALGERAERTITFDINRIVRDDIQELDVVSHETSLASHYTEIRLESLYSAVRGKTLWKIKEHLASIYRVFLREHLLTLKFDGQELRYTEPEILRARSFSEPEGEMPIWRKDISLDFGGGQSAKGFAALRKTGSTAEAGFALFRRKRLIQGSADDSYRPNEIFGASNSYTYQRLFGELEFEGFEVSHTKDGFQWKEHEDIVLEALRDELDSPPLRLISQAEGYRSRARVQDVRSGAEVATDRTADTIERDAPQILEAQLGEAPTPAETPTTLPSVPLASRRVMQLELDGACWQIDLELSVDPAVGDWVFLSDSPSTGAEQEGSRHLAVRVALAHPFMERFGGTRSDQIEPLLRIAVALVLAEVTAREAGLQLAGSIRKRVNELLRDALSKP